MSIIITFHDIYHPCNLLLPVDPFEYGPWNAVCLQCHKRRPPIYFSEVGALPPGVCMVCYKDNREAANRALSEDKVELLRKEMISEQQRRRDIEYELTQIKLQVCNILLHLLFHFAIVKLFVDAIIPR